MKFLNTLLAAVAVTAVLAGCDDGMIDNTGIDTSKTAPEGFTYDEENSSESTIALYWNATAAIESGAKSFTVQIPQTLNGGDNYDNSVSHTLSADDENCDMTSFSNLALGSYYARIRANYPKSKYSAWVYLTDANGEPLAIESKLSKPVISVKAYAEKITVTWDAISNATSYTVEYKLANASTWTSENVGKVTSYQITGLRSATEYQVRVKANEDNLSVSSDYSKVADISTREKGVFPRDIDNADDFIDLFSGEELETASETDVVNITADIDLAGQEFNGDLSFPGILNGNGHTVSNIVLNSSLFNEVNQVKDITIAGSATVSSPIYGSIAKTSTGEFTNVTSKINATYSITETSSTANIIAGIVAKAGAKLTDCTNAGTITVTSSVSIPSTVLAGVVGYTASETSGCKNEGSLSISAPCLSEIVNVEGKAVPIVCGGVIGISNSTVTDCSNSGSITYSISSIDNLTVTSGVGRVNVGGIIAAPNGDITNCENSGTINVSVKSSDGSAYSSANFILGVAGISGGDSYADNTSNTNITGCTNTGSITVDFDTSKSNSTVGGIVAWPGTEAASQTNVIKDCINRGNIYIKGAGKGRFGGVTGGAGNLDGCENYGTVTNDISISSSCVGGVNGYSNYTLYVRNCKSYGNVTNNVDGDVIYTGGLIGAQGGQNGVKGEGCTVKCTVTTKGTQKYCGMILGRYNGDKNITLGSESSPVKVSGTIVINGVATELTSSNFTDYCTGTEREASTKRPVYAEFGE